MHNHWTLSVNMAPWLRVTLNIFNSCLRSFNSLTLNLNRDIHQTLFLESIVSENKWTAKCNIILKIVLRNCCTIWRLCIDIYCTLVCVSVCAGSMREGGTRLRHQCGGHLYFWGIGSKVESFNSYITSYRKFTKASFVFFICGLCNQITSPEKHIMFHVITAA